MTLSAADKEEIRNFVKERDAMLLKLDIKAAREFHRKWNPHSADVFDKMSDDVVLRALHKARTAALSLPLEERKFSKDWLTMRRSATMDDGTI